MLEQVSVPFGAAATIGAVVFSVMETIAEFEQPLEVLVTVT